MIGTVRDVAGKLQNHSTAVSRNHARAPQNAPTPWIRHSDLSYRIGLLVKHDAGGVPSPGPGRAVAKDLNPAMTAGGNTLRAAWARLAALQHRRDGQNLTPRLSIRTLMDWQHIAGVKVCASSGYCEQEDRLSAVDCASCCVNAQTRSVTETIALKSISVVVSLGDARHAAGLAAATDVASKPPD